MKINIVVLSGKINSNELNIYTKTGKQLKSYYFEEDSRKTKILLLIKTDIQLPKEKLIIFGKLLPTKSGVMVYLIDYRKAI